MTDEPEEGGFDFMKLLDDLRKSASVKTGAMMFGEAQVVYYDTLKEHMTEEMAYNLLAHTTEQLIKGVAIAAGPVAEALLKAAALWDRMGIKPSDKEVPGRDS